MVAHRCELGLGLSPLSCIGYTGKAGEGRDETIHVPPFTQATWIRLQGVVSGWAGSTMWGGPANQYVPVTPEATTLCGPPF